MESLDRFEPETWSSDEGVVVSIPPMRRARQFASRTKERWIARTATATLFTLALAVVPNIGSITVPESDAIQQTAVSDSLPKPRVASALREVEPGHWGKLMSFLNTFPRDETRESNHDPDPFT
ncbi:MAG TPA: hypothetical protein VIW95_05685 [Candidatus Binatus sp.]|uniref:hypothetical protein n=1 Tax=Candidatus Binatus sp. TaxID=2811406 RepID=UPI002F3F6C54